MYHTSSDSLCDQFKNLYKYYKTRKSATTFNHLISSEHFNSQLLEAKCGPYIEDSRIEILGLKCLKTWQLYKFKNHPGLLLIKNPFTALGQRYWIRRCLENYPKKPNNSNINFKETTEDLWFLSNGNISSKHMQKKLLWATFGYQHNWDTKVYSEAEKTPFPDDLTELCSVVAKYLNFNKFKPEAAIVNYYNMNSSMSPHTDHSEVNVEAPLFSFSFGQSAIFLIGGTDKSVVPSPILINSGDIIVMSKEARLSYHAVPRIVKTTSSPWNGELCAVDTDCTNTHCGDFGFIKNSSSIRSMMNENMEQKTWDRFSHYISRARININIRQVLHDGQTSL